MKERRKQTASSHSSLPKDYTGMLSGVFAANFSDRLKQLPETERLQFLSNGEIYGDEVVIHVSLVEEGKLAATTVHASCDFDPKASSPTVEDLLAICVDAVGDVFSSLFEAKPDPEGNPAILSPALSALGNAPFEWTETEVNKRKIWIKIDKSNPVLDQAADDWLAKNDPDFEKRLKEQEKDAESLFVLPPKNGGKPGSGLH
jgi:hypothetical protein